MPRKRLVTTPDSSLLRSPRRARVRDVITRRDGRDAQVLILVVLLAWIALAGPALSWLMPTHPWLVLFLTLTAPAAIALFVVGHVRGWWDMVLDTDPLDARDTDR